MAVQRRATLGRERIVAAALRVIDAEGIDGLSMRRLARILGTAPMSLYRHVRGKDELLALVAEEVAGRLPDVPPPEEPWRDVVVTVLRGARTVLLDHPGIARLVGSPIALTPAVVRSHEAVLHALVRAGLDAEGAARAAAVLWTFTLGSVLAEQVPTPTPFADGTGPDDERLRAALRRAGEAGAPHLAAAVGAWERDTRQAVFERGVEALLHALAPLAAVDGRDGTGTG